MDSEFRAQVMNSLGKQSARIMQENCEDLFGPGDYKKGYINTLNLRSTEYSEFEFSRNGSNYSYTDTCQKMSRCHGLQSDKQMGYGSNYRYRFG